jgi:dinuclear metal center YbgI/SA1388 family protein
VISLDSVISELDRLLDPGSFSDFGPNGLQVPGPDQVRKMVSGVSASVQLHERAAAEGAQLVLVHHGLFWRGMPQHIDRALHRRLKPLFDHDIALAAYHLPLDGHPELGNNALLAKGLGCERTEPFARHEQATIGVGGHFAGDGIDVADLVGRVTDLTERDPLVLDFGPARVRSVGIVSGAGADYLGEAIAAGHDALLTGEPTERVFTQAREAGIHVIAAGHYATETFGVRALGDFVEDRFGIEHVFLHDPNPI